VRLVIRRFRINSASETAVLKIAKWSESTLKFAHEFSPNSNYPSQTFIVAKSGSPLALTCEVLKFKKKLLAKIVQ
jgi:hypothetical protein